MSGRLIIKLIYLYLFILLLISRETLMQIVERFGSSEWYYGDFLAAIQTSGSPREVFSRNFSEFPELYNQG